MNVRVTKREIIATLVAKKFFRTDNLAIYCENISSISYKDVLECYLALSLVRKWYWVDESYKIANHQPLWIAISNIVRDIILWAFIYLNDFQTVSILFKKINGFISFDIGKKKLVCLFLRTDHWFNVKSGGSVGHISGVINGLRSLADKVHVVSTDYLVGVQQNSWFYLCQPLYKIGRNLPQIPELLYNHQLLELIYQQWEQWSPSFIYQRYSLGNYVGVSLKLKYKVPYICEYNGSFPWMARNWGGRRLFHEKLLTRIELLNLKAADVVVVVSQPMKDELIGRGIEADKILVNPNGVDPEQYSPNVDGSRLRHQYSLENKTVIGFIGTFGKWHGAEVLAAAFGRLLQDFPDYRQKIRLLLIGDGVTMSQVKEQLTKFNVMDACILTGLISQEEGSSHLAACDILVSPHVPNPDGTPFFGSPTKLFEYMAMGKGIVASDLNQIGEILKHDHTAWMVKPGDVDDLKLGLKVLIDDQQRRERLGEAAWREVVAKYTWKEHTRKIIEKLKERCG